MKKLLALALLAFTLTGCRRNQAPALPAAPGGPSVGAKDSLHVFTAMTTDPDGDEIYYRFAWGDGDTSDWTPSAQEGQPVEGLHRWRRTGVFEVTAQAKDAGDSASTWSPGHELRVVDIWSRAFGGTNGDYGSSVQPTPDGGYVIAGWTYSYGAGMGDIWLIKTDASGNKLWDKTFGGADPEDCYSVQPTSDGGYIIVGGTTSYGAGIWDIWLVKTDASGNKLWDKTFGGTDNDGGSSVQQTTDGGYVVVGNTYSYGAGDADIWLIKTDASGNKLWDRVFGGPEADVGRSVQQTTDGGYVITGSMYSYGTHSTDVWLVKTDSAGNQIWDKIHGGTDGDYGGSVQQTTDGGYVVTGCTYSYGAGAMDVWLVKTDSSGNEVWDTTFGGPDYDYGRSVRQTADGGYVIAGRTNSFGAGSHDVWLIRTDAFGHRIWDKTFGGTDSDEGDLVQPTPDNGFIVTGSTHSYGAGECDVWLIKTDGSGLMRGKREGHSTGF